MLTALREGLLSEGWYIRSRLYLDIGNRQVLLSPLVAHSIHWPRAGSKALRAALNQDYSVDYAEPRRSATANPAGLNLVLLRAVQGPSPPSSPRLQV